MMVMGSSRGCVLAYSTEGDSPRQVARIGSDKGNCRCLVKLCSEGRYIFCASVERETWSTVGVEDFKACVKGAMHDGERDCECKQTRAGIYRCKMCPVPRQCYTAVDVSSDGERFATGDKDGAVVLWDAGKGTASQFLLSHTSRISSVSFSAKGDLLLSASFRGCLIVWDTATAARLHTIDNAAAIEWAKFSPTINEDFVMHKMNANAATTIQAVLEMFHLNRQEEPTSLFVQVDIGPSFGTFSNDGLFIATRCKEHHCSSVALVDSGTGAYRTLVYGRSARVAAQSPTAVAFSPDSSQLAVSYVNHYVVLWSTTTAQIVTQFTALGLVDWDNQIISLSWGRDYVREKTAVVSFAMGLHPRLGVNSSVIVLDKELMRMIISFV